MSSFFLTVKELDKINSRIDSFKSMALSLVDRHEKKEKISGEEFHDILLSGARLISVDTCLLIQACKLLMKDNQSMVKIMMKGVEAKKKDLPEIQDMMLEKLATITFKD